MEGVLAGDIGDIIAALDRVSTPEDADVAAKA
jgi:hypothetical protein